MDNASKYPCEVLYNTTDPKYDENIRLFQGCPTIAVTRGGRIYLGWYAGGTREPHMDNYNLLIYSDDGKSWSKPLLVIPSSYEMCVQALDIQIYIDREGALHVCWVQNNTLKHSEHPDAEGVLIDGYLFFDPKHTEWEMVCYDPDHLGAEASNRDSNKGIYDNNGNEYTELTKQMAELNNQKYNLIDFFDKR